MAYIDYQGGDADGLNARQHMAMKAINGIKGLQAAAKERCSMLCNLLVALCKQARLFARRALAL